MRAGTGRRHRVARVLVSVFLVAVVGAGGASAAASRQQRAEPPPGAVLVGETAYGVEINGIDLHDGMVAKFGGVYHFYGTMYGCGFNWGQPGTPWCGFGVSTARSLTGPWSPPRLLFSPSHVNYFTDTTWAANCGSTGAGCFNARMVQRTWGPADGVFMLWFNAPADYNRNGANAYYVMGCNSSTGPCGSEAGPPYGSTLKPPLHICGENGDFSIVTDAPHPPSMMCTAANQTLSQEQLDHWGTAGVNVGSKVLGGLTGVESPGAYFDRNSERWVMLYSDPNCGYCAGDPAGWATAGSPMGPWSAPANTGVSAPPAGRRMLSATSCGGQVRTVSVVDGQAYAGIDLWGRWNGSVTNQAPANTLLVSLKHTPRPSPPGSRWAPQFAQWPCA